MRFHVAFTSFLGGAVACYGLGILLGFWDAASLSWTADWRGPIPAILVGSLLALALVASLQAVRDERWHRQQSSVNPLSRKRFELAVCREVLTTLRGAVVGGLAVWAIAEFAPVPLMMGGAAFLLICGLLMAAAAVRRARLM